MTSIQIAVRLARGYLLSVAIETPVLVACLSRRHAIADRIFAGLWLTGCTYPVVGIVIPALIDPVAHPGSAMLLAETFAPVAECLLFRAAFGEPEQRGTGAMRRDFAAITAANLASFGIGGALQWAGLLA